MDVKDINTKISEQVDYLIDNINSSSPVKKENLSEALLPKILKFIGFGMPKDRKFRAYLKSYEKCVKACEKSNESEKTTYKSKSDTYYNMDDKTSDRDIKDTEKMDSEIIKNNPELGRCLTRCRVMLLKGMVNLIKEKGDKICEKNKDSETCKEWIESNLPEMESELEYLENAVKMLNKVKGDSRIKSVLKKTHNVLNKD